MVFNKMMIFFCSVVYANPFSTSHIDVFTLAIHFNSFTVAAFFVLALRMLIKVFEPEGNYFLSFDVSTWVDGNFLCCDMYKFVLKVNWWLLIFQVFFFIFNFLHIFLILFYFQVIFQMNSCQKFKCLSKYSLILTSTPRHIILIKHSQHNRFKSPSKVHSPMW